ncbi:hypothetical protein VTN00DRAFT_994 [Thermoascus crustaceus]|uniref:uncharacterized protein n=1 Tax=Thermoascus crustaceus TaxID=5088 RepID=UPI00374218F8
MCSNSLRSSTSSRKVLALMRHASSVSSGLHQEMTARRLPLIYDYLSPQPAHLLDLSLVDFFPALYSSSAAGYALPKALPSIHYPRRMAVGHHLVYFPPQVTLSQLLPDGTDILHAPGEPFNRRMWAGGRARFPQEGGPLLDGKRAVCVEVIRDVTLKGQAGEEKVFVNIERRIATVEEGEDEEDIRGRICRDDEEDPGDAVVIERRDLVFLREKTSEQLRADKAQFGNNNRIVKPPLNPQFSHKIKPTKALLFRYSALTFNAHFIHHDKAYTQDVEGYRNLLVHGPLSLTLMLTVTRFSLFKLGRVVREIEYRNLTPLYVEEEMNICAKPKSGRGLDVWDVWIEGKDGGLAVRGTVKTSDLEDGDRDNRF